MTRRIETLGQQPDLTGQLDRIFGRVDDLYGRFAEVESNQALVLERTTDLLDRVEDLLEGGGGTLPTVTLSGNQTKPEGNGVGAAFTFTVTRSSSNGAITVPWAFASGTTSPSDFAGGAYPTGGTVAIADGSLTGTFSVLVSGDTDAEEAEVFTVSIVAPAGYAPGGNMSAMATITNDDGATEPGSLQRLSAPNMAFGQAGTYAIAGAQPGSTITGTFAGMTINSAARTLTGTPTARAGLIRETLDGVSRDSLIVALKGGVRTMKLGMGLTGVLYYKPNRIFMDHMKCALISKKPLTETAQGVPLSLSPDGYGGYEAVYILPVDDGRTTPVKYIILTDGDYGIDVRSGADYPARGVERDTNGRQFFVWDQGETTAAPTRYQLTLRITSITAPGTYFHVIRESDLAAWNQGKRFKPEFINAIRNFGYLRMMDWMAVNLGATIPMNDNYISFDLESGKRVPLKWQVDACLEANTGIWLSVPADTTVNDFIAMFPQLDRLRAKGLQVYVEYGNEVWNDKLGSYAIAKALGESMGYGVENTYLGGLEYVGYQTGKMAIAARGKGYRFVMGAQPSDPGYKGTFVLRGFDDSGAVNADIYAWTGTSYASGTLMVDPTDVKPAQDVLQQKWMQELNADAAFDNIVNAKTDLTFSGTCYSIERGRAFLAGNKAIADARGWKLMTYEGNPLHLDWFVNLRTRPYYNDLCFAMPNNPLMYAITLINLEVSQEAGVDGFTLFEFDGAPADSKFGVFGHYGRPAFPALREWVDSQQTVVPAGYRYIDADTTRNLSGQMVGETFYRSGLSEVTFFSNGTALDKTGWAVTSDAPTDGNVVARVIDGSTASSYITNGGLNGQFSGRFVIDVDPGNTGNRVLPDAAQFADVIESTGLSWADARVRGSNDGQMWQTLMPMRQLNYVDRIASVNFAEAAPADT